jgi:hypothetical protein
MAVFVVRSATMIDNGATQRTGANVAANEIGLIDV